MAKDGQTIELLMNEKKDNTRPMGKFRAKQRAAGLVPVESWVHPARKEQLKRYVARNLQKPLSAESVK